MDEVHIRDDLVYDKHKGALVGFVNLGQTNDYPLQFESSLSSNGHMRSVANSMLVLMVIIMHSLPVPS